MLLSLVIGRPGLVLATGYYEGEVLFARGFMPSEGAGYCLAGPVLEVGLGLDGQTLCLVGVDLQLVRMIRSDEREVDKWSGRVGSGVGSMRRRWTEMERVAFTGDGQLSGTRKVSIASRGT